MDFLSYLKSDFATLKIPCASISKEQLLEKVLVYFPKASCPYSFRVSLKKYIKKLSQSDTVAVIRDISVDGIPPLKILNINCKTFKMSKTEFKLSKKQKEVKCLFRKVIISCHSKHIVIGLRMSAWLSELDERTEILWQRLLSTYSLL